MTGEDSRRYRRGAALLTLGVGSSGVLTYAYFALASHELEPDAYGRLVVLWSVLFVAVVTLYRPVEQFISRSIAERERRERPYGEALRVAGAIQLALALAFLLAALLLRGPIRDELFGGEDGLYAVFLVAGPAYAVSFFARGYLAGRRRFGLYGAMLMLESTSRFSLALAAIAGLSSGVSFVALGIVVAPLLSLTVVPLVALGRGMRRGPQAPSAPDPAGLPDLTDTDLGGGGRFVGAAFVIMLSEQVLLNVGVIFASASADAAAAGLVFNVLLIARAPQVLFQAVTTSLLPSLSRIRAGAGRFAEASFRREVRTTIVVVASFTAAAAAVLAAAGPALMQLTFGDGSSYDRAGLLIVAAGMGMHLTALTLTQAALARDRAAAAAVRWAACALGFTLFMLVPVLDEVRRVEVGYAASAAALMTLLALLYRHDDGRDQDPHATAAP